MKANIDIRARGDRIDRHVYGHFSEHLGRCVYGGYWVGEESSIPNVRGIRSDIVQAMRDIRVPNIRWPGGCFADDYNWMDGIGPRESRPPMINVHWGGAPENNHFGTHEFMDLCEQVGCQPYICGNVGSGTVREMRNWVEYLTDAGSSPMAALRRANGRDEPWDLPFFGIGNENWGCGGNMTAEYYANEFRRYATYVRNYKGMGTADWWKVPPVMKIAGGANVERPDWTRTLMRDIGAARMGGLSVHCYVKPGEESHGTVFSEDSWYRTAVNTLAKERLIQNNIDIMDEYDPDKKVAMAVDEWGIWVDNEPGSNPGFLYQQNTMRSALCAVLMLHLFHRHADRIRLANLAQTINVLQSICLTDGERMVRTPTCHAFDLLKEHQDGEVLEVEWTDRPASVRYDLPQVELSASIKEGAVHLSAVNLSADKPAEVTLRIAGGAISETSGRMIAGDVTAHNTFEDPDRVSIQVLPVDSAGSDGIAFQLPPCGIAGIQIRTR